MNDLSGWAAVGAFAWFVGSWLLFGAAVWLNGVTGYKPWVRKQATRLGVFVSGTVALSPLVYACAAAATPL